MSHPQWQVNNPSEVVLSGDLDRDDVPELWRFILQWQPSVQQVNISLAKVDRIDSSGMVLLIHLIEHAKNKNCHIMLDFVPEKLRTLFQLSNVESLVAQHIKE